MFARFKTEGTRSFIWTERSAECCYNQRTEGILLGDYQMRSEK